MNKRKNVPIFLDCKVGGVSPVTAEIRFIDSNYISENIIKKTAKIVKDKEDSMYPHIDNKGELINGLYFTVKNSKGDDIVIGHKDNYFTVIEEPNILILGTPWLWLFEVSLNLRHEYLTIYHYKDKIRIYGKYSRKRRLIRNNSYTSPSSDSDTKSSDNFETDSE